MQRFVFVLEQTLGHVAHSRNLVRALSRRSDIDATVIRIPFDPASRAQKLPGLRNWSYRASRAARSALRTRLESGPVDAIFIHTQVAALFSVGIMRRVPTVVSLDATPINFDTVSNAYRHRRHLGVIESMKRSVNRRALHEAAALVTWADWATRSLAVDYGVEPRKIYRIHPGVDLDLFRPSTARRNDDGVLRVLFVGGDFERKGGPELLDALAQLGPRVRADIVTPSLPDAPIRSGFQHHPGLQPQSEALLDLYRNADLFVLPARGDCFPQAIAEAMACGLPVISTRVGAIGEMVRDGVNGLLVRPGSSEDLVRAINSLADNPPLRLQMGQAGRELALNLHDAMGNSHRIFDLLTQVTAKDRRLSLTPTAGRSKA